MTSDQVIAAIEATLTTPPIKRYESEVVDIASEALGVVFATLRQANPCPACGGSGRDESKPFNAANIVTGQQCDACAGNGFVITDGVDAVFDWAREYDDGRLQSLYGRPENDMTSDEVRALRVRLGLSQHQFAEAINRKDTNLRTSTMTVSRWVSILTRA